MVVQATFRHATGAALDHAVEGIPGNCAIRIDAGASRNILAGIKVEGLVIQLVVSAEEADTQPHVQSQIPPDMPVILEIRLKDFVAVVILGLRVLLAERRDVSHQQVGQSVPRAYGRGVVEYDEAVRSTARAPRFKTQLVLLRSDEIGSGDQT